MDVHQKLFEALRTIRLIMDWRKDNPEWVKRLDTILDEFSASIKEGLTPDQELARAKQQMDPPVALRQPAGTHAERMAAKKSQKDNPQRVDLDEVRDLPAFIFPPNMTAEVERIWEAIKASGDRVRDHDHQWGDGHDRTTKAQWRGEVQTAKPTTLDINRLPIGATPTDRRRPKDRREAPYGYFSDQTIRIDDRRRTVDPAYMRFTNRRRPEDRRVAPFGYYRDGKDLVVRPIDRRVKPQSPWHRD